MKRILRSGLWLTAALIAAALLTAGSASATSLCREKVEACPAAQKYPMGSTLEAEVKQSTKVSVAGVECSASTMTDVLVEETVNPLYDEIKTWTFAECTKGATKCNVTVEGLPIKSEIYYSALNPTMVLAKISGEPRVKVECLLVTCIWSVNGKAFNFEGGKPALLAINEALSLSSGLCAPEEGKLAGTWSINRIKVGKETLFSPSAFVAST